MIDFIIYCCGAIWFGIKFYKKREIFFLFVALMFFEMGISRYPVDLGARFIFFLWAFTAAAFMIYENLYRKGLKATDKIIYIYIAFLIALGLVVSVDVFIK